MSKASKLSIVEQLHSRVLYFFSSMYYFGTCLLLALLPALIEFMTRFMGEKASAKRMAEFNKLLQSFNLASSSRVAQESSAISANADEADADDQEWVGRSNNNARLMKVLKQRRHSGSTPVPVATGGGGSGGGGGGGGGGGAVSLRDDETERAVAAAQNALNSAAVISGRLDGNRKRHFKVKRGDDLSSDSESGSDSDSFDALEHVGAAASSSLSYDPDDNVASPLAHSDMVHGAMRYPETGREHSWQKVRGAGRSCDFCGKKIWLIMAVNKRLKGGFKCVDRRCDYSIHKQCLASVKKNGHALTNCNPLAPARGLVAGVLNAGRQISHVGKKSKKDQ
jgi:hypothetical protein